MNRTAFRLRAHCLALRPLAVATFLACNVAGMATAQTLPGGATVINGTVGIENFTNGMRVVNSPGAIIDWARFSIASGQTVRFEQLNAASAVLNRVTGNTPSQINGALDSNGRVFLINSNGIVFGAGARVDTAGLLASTLDISNEDFLAGRYSFSCANSIACDGGVDALDPFTNRIVLRDGSEIRTAGTGGQVWLIARDRITSEKGSRVQADGGQVMAAAARDVTIASPALGQMSFTLAGTSGSRIDLAGDIHAPRGAAGFFADSIHFAGAVRAKSDVGAVGQIVAQASSTVLVDGDARLDVSGTLGASAGTVRLGATQKITVGASALIDASALVTADSSQGLAGLIELSAAEVQLPGKLSVSAQGPRQLDVSAYRGTSGSVTNRSGRVNVLESGSFSYAAQDGSALSGAGSQTSTVTQRGLGNFANANGSQDRVTQLTMAASGDGQYLVITERTTVDMRFVENVDKLGTEIKVYQAHVVDDAGNIVSSRTLATDTATVRFGGTGSSRQYKVLGLTKGGFVVVEGTTITFPGGAAVVSADMTSPLASMRPLLGGGLVVEYFVAGAPVRQVFDAQGRGLTGDVAAAALADEKATVSFWGAKDLNFEGWREVQLNSAFEPGVRNLASGGFVKMLQPIASTGGADTELLATVNETAVFVNRRFFRNQDLKNVAEIGVAVAGVDTVAPVLLTGFRERTDTTVHDKTHSGFYALDSNHIAYFTQEFQSDAGELRVLQQAPRITTRTSSESDRVTFGVIKRTQDAPPPVSSTATARFAVPLLLANLPDQSNGEFTGAVGGGNPDPNPNPNPNPNPGTSNPGRPLGALPPPTYMPPTRLADPSAPGGGVIRAPGSTVSAQAARNVPRLEDGQADAGQLAAASDIVGDLLGDDARRRFDRAETARDRGAILDEAAYAQAIGPEMYEATREMEPRMRAVLFTSLATLQAEGLHNDDDFSEGLNKALTEKVYTGDNPDGSRGTTRTALFVPLAILQADLAQAEKLDLDGGKKARDRVHARITRELILAGREAAGEEVDDTADVVFTRPDGTEVRITEDGEMTRGRSPEA